MSRMRSFIIGACVVLAATASAQFRGGFTSNLDYNPGILGAPAVQKELKLSPDQVKKFQTSFGAVMQKYGGMRRTPGEKPDQAKMEANMKAASADAEKVVNNFAKTLKPEQRKRWHELSLQSMGAGALSQEKVAHEVGLNATQIAKVKKVLDDARAKMRGAGGPGQGRPGAGGGSRTNGAGTGKAGAAGTGGPGGGRPDPATMAKMRSERDAAILKVLNPAQQAKWKAIQGKPFPRDQMRPPMGMGGARNR